MNTMTMGSMGTSAQVTRFAEHKRTSDKSTSWEMKDEG